MASQLLEDHIRQVKASNEDDSDAGSDNEEDWAGWDVESDSDSSSESEGWIDVSSDSDNDLDISDSEDEKDAGGKQAKKVDNGEKDEDRADMADGEQTKNLDPAQSIATTKVRFSFVSIIERNIKDCMRRFSLRLISRF